MTATKVSALPEATTVAANDLIYVVSDPGGSPVSKKIKYTNLLTNVSSNVHFSGNVVGFSNTTLITFDNGVQLGANIEGDNALGFDLSGPATLDYMGMSYGINPANGYASYLTLNKTGGDLNRDHQLNLQLWRGTANSADGGLTQWMFNANGLLLLPSGASMPQDPFDDGAGVAALKASETGYATLISSDANAYIMVSNSEVRIQQWSQAWTFSNNYGMRFPDATFQATAFNTNTQYTFSNTITFSSNVRVHSVIPTANLTYTLGNTTNRFSSLYVGANSITFTDTLSGPDQVLSLANQVFYITQGSGSNSTFNANAGFNAGGIVSQNYNIRLANNSQNLVIGSTSVNTSVIVNQNLLVNTTLTFSDNTVQNTAFIPNISRPRIISGTTNAITIDFSTDTTIHLHTNAGTVTANLINFTAGKQVDVIIYNNIGGTQQYNHGLSTGNRAVGGASFFLCTHPTMWVTYICEDNTETNCFVKAAV